MPQTKHIAIKYHFFKDHIGIKNGKGIEIKKIDTEFQKAGIFTKGLPKEVFEHIQKLLMGW